MGSEVQFFTTLHKRSTRNYLERMQNQKVACSEVARRYAEDYWDGDRCYGFGGYKYDGRWELVARQLIEHYRLPPQAKILDVGCGKGFLLYELQKLLPQAQVSGFDISDYALENAHPEIRAQLFHHRAEEPFPFADDSFDLVLSLTTLHNLPINDLSGALQEMERVGRNKYLVVESFRNCAELFNLQCWALTCETFFRPEGWQWFFEQCGYQGDFEFIYFE